jgi:archaemetzincin
MAIRIALIMALVCLLGGSAAGAARRLILVPCGPVPPEVLPVLIKDLPKELPAIGTPGPEVPIPPEAYNPGRRQYAADAFLPRLKSFRTSPEDLILGITEVDLYTPEIDLNFVLGLADRRQQTAIISLARLHPQFYGLPENPALFHQRALKEAVHELGHLLGLGHCDNPKCIMFFSNTIADTDRKGPGFCQECRRLLGK